MATDFAVSYFFWPVLVGTALLVLLAVAAKRREPGQGFLKLGIRRLAFGYLGALGGLALYALANTYLIGLEKVALGHIAADELPSWIPPWSLYLFILITPFVVLMMTVVGLPLLALLSRYGGGSLVGILLVAALGSLAYATYVFAAPYNQWCEANLVPCAGRALVDVGAPSLVVALGFGLAAGLPLVREGPCVST